MDVKNQPLGDVLEEISAETGYEFNIDESWTNLPVTASIKNEPLHVGLKRILRNFNNAVIYGSDGTIKIKIYDREKSSGQSALNRSYEETVRQPDISENPRTLPPGFAPRDRKRQSQTEENAAEESSESEPEPDEANDNEEATEDKEEEQSNAADEEVATDSESKSAEDTSAEDGAEAAETGAASESDSDTGAAGNE